MVHLPPLRRSLLPLLLAMIPAVHAYSGNRHVFADSIKAISGDSNVQITNSALDAADSGMQLDFSVALKMRNMDALQARIGAGQQVSQADMEANYLPSAAEYAAVRNWLITQGFIITQEDPNHTNVFARGTVAQIENALGAIFAKVATADGKFVSAIAPPSLPSEISDSVLAVNGLQPHVRLHTHSVYEPISGSPGMLAPAAIASAYQAPTSLTGSGQTIAILIDAVPQTSDLTQFWTTCGISQSLSNYTVVNVGAGPPARSPTDGEVFEATLDVEWASGIAPGAAVRLYGMPDSNLLSIQAACTQVLSDARAIPGLRQVSISLGAIESQNSAGALQSISQTFAQLTAQGVTVFAASGDGGSNQGTGGALGVLYPASDPYVTGVGGTLLTLNQDGATIASETGWTSSGGGLSGFFSRPSWQSGTGVPSGTMRCVPDVAAVSSDAGNLQVTVQTGNGTQTTTQSQNTFIVINGSVPTYGGTSLAAPVWAGFCALINQACVRNNLPNVGLLGPRIYPLIGTTSFRDITSGSNGAYSAGVGYDLVTGIGSPNVGALVTALSSSGAPAFTLQPAGGTVNAGSTVTLSAQATGTPAPSYQWYFNGGAISGATNSTLTLANIGTTQAGSFGNYTVIATNQNGSVTSSAASITVSVNSFLFNISTYGYVGSGTGQDLDAGFFIYGSGTKNILVMGAGPNLANAGNGGSAAFAGLVLAAPELAFDGVYPAPTSLLGTNPAWGGGQALINAMKAVYAPVFVSNSNDTAITGPVTVSGSNGYTVDVTINSGGPGLALVEVDDVDSFKALPTIAPSSYLANISTRGYVGAGGGSGNGTGISQYEFLDAGFTIFGSTSQTLLIRAVGPSLNGAPAPTLAKPKLALYDSAGNVIATNTGWGTAPVPGNSAVAAGIQPATTAIMNSVFASTITPGSNDCAMVVTLPSGTSGQGAYTAKVTSADGTSAGIALVEVYNLP